MYLRWGVYMTTAIGSTLVASFADFDEAVAYAERKGRAYYVKEVTV